jgi:hypothetical protein
LKCRNEDCKAIAGYILGGSLPEDNCLSGPHFTMLGFVKGILKHAGWSDVEKTCDHFSGALTELLSQYAASETRNEYNSIKHGLRAHHGSFGIEFGIQSGPGLIAAPEDMESVGQSIDGSHFIAVKPIDGFSAKDNRQQFSVEQVSLSWSLEKTLTELQMFSSLIGNLITALKIVAGRRPSDLVYYRLAVPDEWWDGYFQIDRGSLVSSSMSSVILVQGKPPKAEKIASEFYRHGRQRRASENGNPPL